MRHQLTAGDEGLAAAIDRDPGERDSSGFVPLDARLIPWQTVMSGDRYRDPDEAAAVDVLCSRLQLSPQDVRARLGFEDEPVLAQLPNETNYERRAKLRRERKRLVGILHHQTGREYREIQQEINEIVAAGRSVDEHTLPELEVAIRALTRQIASLPGGQSRHAA